MLKITRGGTKDLILESIIRKKDPIRNSDQIKTKLFPNKSNEEIRVLLKEINESTLETPTLYFGRSSVIVIDNGLTSETLRNGGFTKIEQDLLALEAKEELKEKLDVEIKNLQKENLQYQKQIRDQESKIRELRMANLRLGNWDIRFRWFIAVGTFISGLIIQYFIK